VPAWLIALGGPLAKWVLGRVKKFSMSVYEDYLEGLHEDDPDAIAEEVQRLAREIRDYRNKNEEIPAELIQAFWAANEKLTTFD